MVVMAETCLQLLLEWLRLVAGLVSQQFKLLPALLQGKVVGAASASSKVIGDAVSAEKEEFLQSFGGEYGYSKASFSIDLLRATEFRRLGGTVYLDHAGATLYSDGQLQAVLQNLSENLYGNPRIWWLWKFVLSSVSERSQNDSSTRTAELIDAARSQVLKLCNASVADYKCIFTSGATAALKLVGESFPWSSASQYLYTMENHNSVLGLREYALDDGATVAAVDVECSGVGPDCIRNFKLRKPQKRCVSSAKDAEGEVYNLFAFPGECNFSGAKFNLELVHHVKRGNHMKDAKGKWMVLIDAAKSCGTSPPNLAQYPADFVAISFYKIFGYPTGLGALLVQNEGVKLLRKKYFSGGTVSVSIADVDFMKRRDSVEHWFEDGTSSFLAIAALRHGFAVVNELTLPAIQRHAGALTKFTVSKLMSMRHKDGREVCRVYGNHSRSGNAVAYWGQLCEQGPVIAFNLKRSDGSWVGYHEVERLASLNSIHLRGGCFCNPGACAKYIELSHFELQQNFEAGHVCWDDNDVMNGKPTGAVRVSFGYMSSYEDAMAFISFVSKYFVESDYDGNGSCAAGEWKYQDRLTLNGIDGETDVEKKKGCGRIILESIIVYPIKSCAGFTVDSWYLSDTGLLYDREFCIVTATGTTLTQKMNPAVCLIQTHVDLSAGLLYIKAVNKENGLVISLKHGAAPDDNSSSARPVPDESDPMVAQWLSELLGVSCKLVRRESKKRWTKERQNNICVLPRESSASTPRKRSELSFVNEGQFLLVSRASIDDLNRRLTSYGQGGIEVKASQFRPNLVISGGSPYAEDTWSSLKMGDERLLVLGGCNRCQMININPQTGHRDNQLEPLRTLSTYRTIKGQVLFGVLLIRDDIENVGPEQQRVLRVGWDVNAECC